MRYPVSSKPAISLDFTPGEPPENIRDLLLKYKYTVPSVAPISKASRVLLWLENLRSS